MITEWLITLLVDAVTFFLSLLTLGNPPAWLENGQGGLQTVFTQAAQLSNWVPYEIVPFVLPAVLASLLLGLGIHTTRIILSFLTLGGGGT